MGSDERFIDTTEAASILAVTEQMVHKYVEKGMLPCHYPETKKAGKRRGRQYLRMDVQALAELREAGITNNQAALTQQVLGMAVTVRRLEQGHDELLCYLGMTDQKLPIEQEDVYRFYLEAKALVEHPLDADDHRDILWARRLLPISEEYLALVKRHTMEEEPWQAFMRSLKHLLLIHSDPGPVRIVLEHALLNLRNAAFLYVCNNDGPRMAKTKFPGSSYTHRVTGMIFPLS